MPWDHSFLPIALFYVSSENFPGIYLRFFLDQLGFLGKRFTCEIKINSIATEYFLHKILNKIELSLQHFNRICRFSPLEYMLEIVFLFIWAVIEFVAVSGMRSLESIQVLSLKPSYQTRVTAIFVTLSLYPFCFVSFLGFGSLFSGFRLLCVLSKFLCRYCSLADVKRVFKVKIPNKINFLSLKL